MLIGWTLTTNLIVITEKVVKFILIYTIIGAASNILLNYILIPPYKGNGAVIASLISHLLSATVTISFFSQTRRIALMQLKSIIRFYDVKPE